MSRMLYRNLALVGPPGSGKGTYGKMLSQALSLPLVTVSDVLRQQTPKADLSSGKLVDDDTVSEALLNHIGEMDGYILDGFPRTLAQVDLMQNKWPITCQVDGAILFDVPDKVCEAKTLGRRACKRCGENYNTAAVHFDGFDMPPNLPDHCSEPDCDPETDWQGRDDDTPKIVQHRLQIYHQHADPILSYFESQNQLLRFAPYKGIADKGRLISTVQDWRTQET